MTDTNFDPFEPLTDDERTAATVGLDQLAATLNIPRYPLEQYPTAGVGDCQDCRTPQHRRQYINVQLCDPCIKLRIRARHHLAHHSERQPELRHDDTTQPNNEAQP